MQEIIKKKRLFPIAFGLFISLFAAFAQQEKPTHPVDTITQEELKDLVYIIARKPQAFKPGDEWHLERSQQSWRSGGKSGIIWVWPDMLREHIRSIGFNIIWYGYRSIGNGC